MRKFIIAALAASVLTPTLATAQTADLRRDGRDARHDQYQISQDQRQIQQDRRQVQQDRRDLRQDQRSNREAWRDYRDQNRNAFHRGPYGPPRGYSYAPVRVGVSLRPPFYANRYWIADPGAYRLPRAMPGTRWVRYGNDVLLVNLRTGRVQTVYSAFFY
ncbi:MAG: RcnB family protein [Proteobacteria bacterium]|nr:RcnB family protein [Pseudomonadota bacterium]